MLSYGLDAVGNRQSLASSVTGIGAQSANYDNNDRVVGVSYDDNGNMQGAVGTANVYDSQDRLKSFNNGAVTMVYDGDGNRVSKTAGGVTTAYLVDEGNPTGLPQVVEELTGGAVKTTYLYGLERISQTQVAGAVTSYYGYDGHGDVRYLTDVTGKVTDTYDYDAFGNQVGRTGATANVYRYQGEAFDAETGLYYLRARYYDPVAGRFLSVDPMADQGEHPYEYAGADPVNGHDPTGLSEIVEYTNMLATFMPPVSELAGMRADIKCFAGLTTSSLANPAMMVAAAGACQVRTVIGALAGGGGGSGGGSGPCGRCSCSSYPVYNPALWNAPGIVGNNNCYTYAWGVPLTGFFGSDWTQPGGRHGKKASRPYKCDAVKAAAVLDGLMYTDNTSCCQKGYHPVVMVVGDHVRDPNNPMKDLGSDYHWYRQDRNGGWSSKHGTTPVGGQVQDPFADARIWGYDQPCGRMCAPDTLK